MMLPVILINEPRFIGALLGWIVWKVWLHDWALRWIEPLIKSLFS